MGRPQKTRKASKRGGGTPQSSLAPSNPVVTGIVCLVLAAIVWIVFGQTLRHEFVNYDDDEYVFDNPRVALGLTDDGIRWAFSRVHADNWHPVTTLSHMLDCELYGLQPWGHHMTNVLLQAAAAIFLFLALRRLTGTFWSSALVAALFAIHPLRVGSVAWVSERKDVLSGVFFMLVLWAYACYARSSRRSWGQYSLVVVLFALGLMSKPTLVTLPFVLLLLDYWPLGRFTAGSRNAGWGNLVLEKIPFFALSAASCVATILAQERALIAMHELTFAERVGNAAVAYIVYLGQMISPARLAVVYPYPEGHVNFAQAILAFLALGIISAICFIWRKKYPFLLIGWLWFLGMLVPMIGIVQVGPQPHADRYTYLPQIGICLLAVWGAAELAAKWQFRREVMAVIAALVIAGFMVASYFQTSNWQNSETLWHQALANTENNHIAENNLGNALVRKERLDEALVHFRKALAIYPDYAEANNNLGFVLANKREWTEAIAAYQVALRIRPNYARARNNYGVSLAESGKTDEAIEQFREALRINPDLADAHCNLGIALLQRGRRDEAVEHLTETLRLKPNSPDVREQLRALGVSR